jgi:hypothetical protein
VNERRWLNIDSARRRSDSGSESLAGAWPIEAFFEVRRDATSAAKCARSTTIQRYQARSGRPPFLHPISSKLASDLPTLVRAYLFGLGEPTLNPNLVDYVAELSASGAEVWFNTNATRIDEAMADRLARAGADRITVSIDGATAPTYEKIRRGAKFADVVRGIRALVAAKQRYGRPRAPLSSFVAWPQHHGNAGARGLMRRSRRKRVHVEPLYQQAASADLTEHYQRENLDRRACALKAFQDAALLQIAASFQAASAPNRAN